ncbi:MAG TPA: hypothetical protein VGR61_08855, partial [Candidatus Dormibacteraeota bacterium]|nr:hypothetical protein [Candidatus Dormibacteraeota bacterium]
TYAIAKRATTSAGGRSIFDLGIRAIGNQVIRGMLHDSLVDHLREVRLKHPEVDFVLIEPNPDDEKMFFHEVMSFSAQMIVLQHGYETVTTGLHRTWPYLSRILPKHGIEVTRRVVDRKPLQVPVQEMERGGNVVARLFQTVLDRRDNVEGEKPEIRSTGKPQQRASDQGSTPQPPRKAARGKPKAATTAARTRSTGRQGFHPRVISGGESNTGG